MVGTETPLNVPRDKGNTNIVEPKVNAVEPKANVVEPKVNAVEPKVNVVEPKANAVEPNTDKTNDGQATNEHPQDTTHHISDVDHWGAADRNYYIFVFLSVIFGFFGLDHMYLRSFGTGTQKLLVNLVTFGMWYVWDIIQIAQDGVKIRENGLSSPLDWIRGIGRGVFKPVSGGGEKEAGAEKSYILYAFLAIFFGWLGADKFYMGYGWQGVAKLLSTWNIFLFLFGLVWILWDGFHAFFMTDSILKDGISAPMPYSFIFTEPIPGEVFKVKEGGGNTAAASKAGCTHGIVWCTLDWAAKTFGLPMPPQGLPLGEIYSGLIAPIISVPLIKEVQALRAGIPAGKAPTMPTINLPNANTMPDIPVTPEEEKAKPAQSGGGRIGNTGPGPVIAGALTALVVAGGLKGVYDFISKQYG